MDDLERFNPHKLLSIPIGVDSSSTSSANPTKPRRKPSAGLARTTQSSPPLRHLRVQRSPIPRRLLRRIRNQTSILQMHDALVLGGERNTSNVFQMRICVVVDRRGPGPLQCPPSVTASKPSQLHLRDVRKSFQPSTSAIANGKRGTKHTWLSYPVEEVPEDLVEGGLEGERRVAGRGWWCVKEHCGGGSTRSGVD